ncbi:3-oxoacyl-ACP synthase III family protein [Paenibacillus xylaniclasticus]|uniref:3-oxoacyl-ACP synthase III family protein n=1 Tax=Paenibacillus xylaniclasticus TaxID=588083 RepID=UPI000FDAD8D9|nr:MULTISPECIES: 3-oxoacyl-ACP synthase III family protein [Paenibacillus]GFN32241.1 3-oxoacyl-[acyl-carrier-protein] synthase 3 [Paenibacillus curdlanolyticus]
MNVTQIIGTGSYLPGEPLKAEQLQKVVGHVAKDLTEALGATVRYWAVDPNTGQIQETNTDMAAKAAMLAIDNAGIEADEIDLIVSVTATPDYSLPANGPIIQDKLGIRDCAVIELRAGCNGVAQAITIADQFIRTGYYRTALIIGSELTSSYSVPSYLNGDESLTKNDLLNLVMFGDGAGAVVLRGNVDSSEPGIIDTYLASIGVGIEPGFLLPAGGSKHPLNAEVVREGSHRWYHDYKAVSRMDVKMAVEAMKGILDKTNTPPEDIQMIIVPQANFNRIKEGAKTEDNPLAAYADRFFVNVDRVGNTSAAGVLIALDEVNRKQLLRRNDLFMIVGAESSKWLCGSILLRWSRGA